MENQEKHTGAWVAQVWISFLISTGMLLGGIWYLPTDLWVKGYLWMGSLFTMGSCFSLAKTLRDNHESHRLINRVAEAKTERILREFENVN